MRHHLDTAVNLAILATCIVVAYVSLGGRPEAARPMPPPPLTPGERLPIEEPAFARTDQTLVLVLRSSCKFCTESMPFYKRLAERIKASSAARAQLIVVTPDQRDDADEYLRQHNLVVPGIVSLTPAMGRSLKLRGTPTLILIDRAGVIRNLWMGKLQPDDERRVETALFGAAP